MISAQQHQAWALKYFETPAIVLTGIAAVTGALSGAMPQLAQVLSPPTLACAMIGQYLMVWVGLKKLELRSEQFRNAGLDYRILATRAENHLRKYGINCKYKQTHHNLTAVEDVKAEMVKIEDQIKFQVSLSDYLSDRRVVRRLVYHESTSHPTTVPQRPLLSSHLSLLFSLFSFR